MSKGPDHLRNILATASWLRWPETQQVFSALTAQGHQARAVGGAVRDTLLSRPVREVDIASTATPDEVMELGAQAGLKVVPTGIDHGTITVIAGDRPFEVTTLREDVETYGRHAKVAYTEDWMADARRRDFTINALYAEADGTLFDPLDGFADLIDRRVRFIGSPVERIREDYLRILRFFRFVAELDTQTIDADGLQACVRERAGLEHLAAERVHGELFRLLAGNAAVRALGAMFDHGLLVRVLGGVPNLPRLERLVMLDNTLSRDPDPTLRLAALAVTVAEDAERLRIRLRLSRREAARLEAGTGHREFIGDMTGDAARAALYWTGESGFRDRVLLAWAADAGHGDGSAWRALYTLPDRWEAPEFPLRGDDIAAMGVPEGPALGAILRGVEEEWIAGGFSADRETLLEAARVRANNFSDANEEREK